MSIAALSQTCMVTLERSSISQDGSAGHVKTFAPIADGALIPCTVQPLSSRERMMFAQRQITYSHRVYFTRDVGLRKDDRITINTDSVGAIPSTARPRRLLVTGYFDMAGRGRCFCAEAKEYGE